MALGARRSQVLQLVLRRTIVHAAAGIIIGLVAASMLTRYLQTLLFGLTPFDPLTFAGAAGCSRSSRSWPPPFRPPGQRRRSADRAADGVSADASLSGGRGECRD
jgi:ABC-type antimicrobial peptide transport system permease subunit